MKVNIWSAHVPEAELARYGAEGQPQKRWRSPWVWFHVSRCERCRVRASAYAGDREYVRHAASLLPTGVNWERLSSEMAANIRVGLAAGECVTPRSIRGRLGFDFWNRAGRGVAGLSSAWRVGAACAGFSLLMVSAWWLNMPAPRTQSLVNAVKGVAAGNWGGHRGGGILHWDGAGSMVRASSQGIELLENGSSMGVSAADVTQGDTRPLAVTLSVQGSARAHYVDADTGQITITSVYAQ